ncbi:CcdB family protein [Methylophaga nitratireducenticrescens]|uniref:Toxin CcdB n=1 Tax=Methylophaga nitratireducenticrescens TaxID=754476 RepID=I1XLK5_METNJ|nr:CcdB family protein [Methylophaga nitratireducenticrescens]AFI85274.1 plasmid maintenance protein CcdB [Methylophaga nitratireducenticrescens]AUZ85759.1 plasmid maintenance protein CcdB [Methylophaga nitratireducenticrescens]
MAQFDVYQNPSKTTRNAFPYLVDIQSPVISEISTRIVIPLGRLNSFKNEVMINLTPVIEYDGEKLLLLTPQIASIPSKLLKDPIGSLNHFRDEIISALDFAITGV